MYNILMSKRPDLSLRNKLNNPMRNKATVEKMRQSLTGRKLPLSTRVKMSEARKAVLAERPELLDNMLHANEAKYLSKVRGKSWRLVRLKALERDDYTCVGCGEKEKRLVVHHIDWQGKRRGVPTNQWNNALDNLVTLCDKCHNGIHRHKSADYTIRYNKAIAP